MWDDVRGNIESLSTEYTKDLTQSLLTGIGGYNFLALQQIAGPILSKIGESNAFQSLKDSVGGFFSMKAKETEADPDEATDKLIEAIDGVVLPPIGVERRKAIQENRVRKNLQGGDKVDLDTLSAVQEGNQEIANRLDDLSTSVVDAMDGMQTASAFPDALADILVIQDKIYEMSKEQLAEVREKTETDRDYMRKQVSDQERADKKAEMFLDAVDTQGKEEDEREFREDQKEFMRRS